MADTGSGVAFSLSVSAQPTCIRSITMPEFTVEDIDVTCLSDNNYKKFIAGALTDPGEVTIEFYWDATASTLIARGAPEVLTVTWPIHTSGNTTNATFVADGYVKSYKLPDFGLDEVQTGTLTFKLNGEDTEPAFTAESA